MGIKQKERSTEKNQNNNTKKTWLKLKNMMAEYLNNGRKKLRETEHIWDATWRSSPSNQQSKRGVIEMSNLKLKKRQKPEGKLIVPYIMYRDSRITGERKDADN